MRVKSKSGNKFLIKDEWYQVTNINDVAQSNVLFDGSRKIHYELENHTDRIWNSSWYSSVNFYDFQELRDDKIIQLLD